MRLTWATEAQRDMLGYAADYDEIDPALTELLIDRIEQAPLRLLDHPRLGRAIGLSDLRKWTVARTPFILLYRVLPDGIEVARIIPVASDWAAR